MDYREIFKRVTAALRAERRSRAYYQERVKTLEAQLAQARAGLDYAIQEIDRIEKIQAK